MKRDKLKQYLTSMDWDFVLLSEHNTNGDRLETRQQPRNIFKGYWDTTITRFEWLRTRANRTTMEPEATAIITNGTCSAHTTDAGGDKRKLGRWNWITVRGREQHSTTVISIYRPSKEQVTAANQLAKIRQTTTGDLAALQPHLLWEKDLKDLIRTKRAEGNEIIVAGDFNDNLNDDNATINTLMRQWGLRNLIQDRIGNGPATYHRERNTIDGVFGTERLEVEQCGYSSFDEAPGDHRWHFLDIREGSMIGAAREDRAPPLVRKATSKIPSVKMKFNDLLDTEMNRHKIGEKVQTLLEEAKCTKALSTDSQSVYNMIESRLLRAVKYADTKCRKARKGQIPFSPKPKRSWAHTEFSN